MSRSSAAPTVRFRWEGSYIFTPWYRKKKKLKPLRAQRKARPVLIVWTSKSIAVSGATPSSQISSACSDS